MNKNTTIGIVMDPIARIKPEKDSTLAMMLGAQSLGADLFYMEQDDLYIKDDTPYGIMSKIEVSDNDRHWFSLDAANHKELTELDVILMRKDPPVDKRFIHSCYMLEHAQRQGVRVINDPKTLTAYNEKILATHFPEYCPPYVISSSLPVLKEFLETHSKIILKPLDAMGGSGVFLVDESDVNFEVIWEMHTDKGRYPLVAQSFIPEITLGDKRIIIINGIPYGHALVRIPKTGSIRGNLAAGGSYDVRPLNEREGEIAEMVGKRLKQDGIFFAGLDIIGDFLIEVNITSPTGLRELSQATGDDLGQILMQEILGSL